MHKLSKQKTHHQVTFSSLSQIHFSPLFLELASCDGMRWSNRTFWLLCAASLGLVLLFSRIFAENYGSISFTTCWLGIPVLPVKHSYRFLYEPWMALGWYTLHTYRYARERLPFFFGFSFEIQIHFICLSLWHDAQIHFAVCVSSGKCCVSWRRETNLCLHWTCIKSLTHRMKYWFKH